MTSEHSTTARWIRLGVDFEEGGNRSARGKPSKPGWDRLKLNPHTFVVEVEGVIDVHYTSLTSLTNEQLPLNLLVLVVFMLASQAKRTSLYQKEEPGFPESNLAELRREPTTSGTRIWYQGNWTRGHIDWKGVFLSLRKACSLKSKDSDDGMVEAEWRGRLPPSNVAQIFTELVVASLPLLH